MASECIKNRTTKAFMEDPLKLRPSVPDLSSLPGETVRLEARYILTTGKVFVYCDSCRGWHPFEDVDPNLSHYGEFDRYQEFVADISIIGPGPGAANPYMDEEVANAVYFATEAGEELGEVFGKLKRVMRRDATLEEVRNDLALEIGDCLWCLTRLADVLGFGLEEVILKNVEKLEARREAGVLQGTGDHR